MVRASTLARAIMTIEFSMPANAPASPKRSPIETRHEVVYGIYFDFAQATIRSASERVLMQIATVLNNNPDWKLYIAGHTDIVGSANANLELSKNRAQAVKAALVERHDIAKERLKTRMC